MTKFRGIERIVSGEGSTRVVEIKRAKASVEPFQKNVRLPMPESFESAADTGLRQFLRIGKKSNLSPALLRGLTDRQVPSHPDPALDKARFLPPITGLRSFFQNIHFYLKRAWEISMGAVGGGLGMPMMIFGIFLFPGRDYGKMLESLNKQLAEFDRLRDMKERGIELRPEEKRLLEDTRMVALDEKRSQLEKDYQSRLLNTYQEPIVRWRRELEHILSDEIVDGPMGLIPGLARNRGLPPEFFAGRLLRKAGRDEIREWLDIWAAEYPKGRRERFPYDVIHWISVHRPDAGIEMLQVYLKYEDPGVRLEAAVILAEMGEIKKATPVLLDLMFHGDRESLRLTAAETLSRYGEGKLAPDFLRILREGSVSLEGRVIAAEFLGRWNVSNVRKDILE
ncbi:MAG: HEAT repeat domain-containing protein, partial [Candidatus Binatia bacterium]